MTNRWAAALTLLATLLMTHGGTPLARPARADAPGLNLSWGDCGTTPATEDHAASCEPGDTPPPLIVSFRVAEGMADFGGVTVVVDFRVEGSEVPPWFEWGTGGAREGALGLVPVAEIAGCSNPYGTEVQGGGFVMSASPGIPGGTTLRLRADWARSSPAPLAPDVLYAALQFQISPDTRRRVAAPRGRVGHGVTPGCALPACFVANTIELYGFSGSYRRFERPDVRAWVTWHASSEMSFPCPAALPTRHSTWGSLKAAYR